jgi:protein-disulfide isomerase
MRNEGIEQGPRAPRIDYRGLRVAALFGGLVMLTVAVGCREGAATPEKPVVQQGAPAPGPETVLASVGDEKITMADVRARSANDLELLETQYQLAKSRIVKASLDSIVYDRTVGAETKKTGKSADELVAAEAGPKGFSPSEADIAAWYQSNQSRLAGRPLDQVRSQIADLLRTERRRAAEKSLKERLSKQHNVSVAYEPYRLKLNNDKAPTLGKESAPVTLVEFSDFQCPFCRAAAPTLKQVAEKFGDKVQIVYRQYPIPSLHPFAMKAAEASLCANEQGKFWQLHDAMFEDQKLLAVSDLKQTARRLGLDGAKFDSCLDSGRYVEQVQNDLKEGRSIGVTGTPAMFVNGVGVDGGSVPFSVLEGVIKEELARTKQ